MNLAIEDPSTDEADQIVFALLREQQRLTAVDLFVESQQDAVQPFAGRHYRDLIPTELPGAGQQYAFDVDLDACSGCKACVAACHNLNGLEEDELWRSVGLLVGGTATESVLQHVTTACHHCVEPACLHGCPVEAYEKDPLTGIVRHLDDQCIGCQYCMLKCPYDVPVYSKSKGIVRKCDMCHQRLASGEAPACVQSCPNSAISIRLVDQQRVREESEAHPFLPGAPDPSYTLPTTSYRTDRVLPRNTLPADYFSVQKQHEHLPLVVMLVLTQMSVGAFVVEHLMVRYMAGFSTSVAAAARPWHLCAALVLGMMGLTASVFHLGRPFFAYRALMGLRTSWLSREILAFSVFAAAATSYVVVAWLDGVGPSFLASWQNGLGTLTAAAGLTAVLCSVMIYVDTRRPLWTPATTAAKFLLTGLILGIPTSLLISLVTAGLTTELSVGTILTAYGRRLCGALALITAAKLVLELSLFLHLRSPQHTPQRRSALLLCGDLSMTTIRRFFFGVIGGIALPLLISREATFAPEGYHPLFVGVIGILMLGLLVIGELHERFLFFAASVCAPDAGRTGFMSSIQQERKRSWSDWWRATAGPLTQDLVQEAGKFGLGQVPQKLSPDSTTQMVCGFCSTGCSLNVHLRDGEAINLTPSADYPVNLGMACPKGWEALSVLEAPDRGTTPLLRDGRGRRRPTDWTSAIDTFCERFQEIQRQHGPESVAFLGTGQIPTEEMAFLGSLAKFGMGILHGDGNTRQCMATSVVAYKQAFGFDAPPYTYDDFEQSDVIILIGSNLCVAHPIMWQRILNNPHHPEIVVIDPRQTETAMVATQHLALRPKSDLALLYGLAHILISKDWIDAEYIADHTNGFEDFRRHVETFDPVSVSESTGIAVEQLERVAATMHNGERVSLWWTMGVNQSYEGVRTAQAIINLALMTGNMGRPGTGANSITGQCNAMGSRLFSNTTNLLGGHEFGNAGDRNKIADVMGIDASLIPDRPSWSYNEIMEGILREQIKGLWIVCTNTAHSWINGNTGRDILDRLDFLVVQDMYASTETAELADLYLPAAGWGEKAGTFINSERRLGVIKKVARAPGQAMSDFNIFRLIADRWGCGEMFADWTSPEAVFETLKELSRGQPCDFAGIEDYAMIDRCGGIQWPFPALTPLSEVGKQRRLFEDGCFYHSDGRARFLFEMPREMPEPPNPKFPYLLMTGRGSAAQWHTQTRTSKSAVLRSLASPQVFVEINPEDARREGIRPNQDVIVESQRGRARVKAFVTPTIQSGHVFMPMHYEQTNCLTHAHFDPYSHQPSYKDCAVRVRVAESWESI